MEQLETMNIDTPPGAHIIFKGIGGGAVDEAKKLLKPGSVYTVEKVSIHNYIPYVTLKEHPGKGFNATMFRNLPATVSVEQATKAAMTSWRLVKGNGDDGFTEVELNALRLALEGSDSEHGKSAAGKLQRVFDGIAAQAKLETKTH